MLKIIYLIYNCCNLVKPLNSFLLPTKHTLFKLKFLLKNNDICKSICNVFKDDVMFSLCHSKCLQVVLCPDYTWREPAGTERKDIW